VIDGFLHGVAFISTRIGSFLRNYIDAPVVNGFGDFVGEGVKRFGQRFRIVQTGSLQQYMIMAVLFALSAMAYFLFFGLQP
jgi:hypothetical protein